MHALAALGGERDQAVIPDLDVLLPGGVVERQRRRRLRIRAVVQVVAADDAPEQHVELRVREVDAQADAGALGEADEVPVQTGVLYPALGAERFRVLPVCLVEVA